MARTHFVKKSQKATRCLACGQEIPVGSSYQWFKMKTTYGGIKKSYHTSCTIPPSHRTTSRMGQIWDAQAALDLSAAEDFDGLREQMEAFGQEIRQVAEEYSESADNMESGFGHATYQSDELRERAEALENWADEVEQWEFSGDEPDPDDYVMTDQEAYDEAYKSWEDEEPSVDESEENEDELNAQISEHEDWEASEPQESEYEIPDEEAFKEAVEEVLQEARDDAESTADNCPV